MTFTANDVGDPPDRKLSQADKEAIAKEWNANIAAQAIEDAKPKPPTLEERIALLEQQAFG